MRVLFVMRNLGYLRNYESTVRMLASRGHDVIVGSRGPERHMAVDTEAFLSTLSTEFPGITATILPRRRDEWASVASGLRGARDALRYRHPMYRRARKLASRAERHLAQRAPRLQRRLPRQWVLAKIMSQLMAAAEAFIPTDPEIDHLVERLAPDALIVTPLVDFNSYQVDYVKTARRMGVPVALAVASWDNLTNKGVIAVQPHRAFVWNDIQKKEAIELHGVPSDRVTVTGAALFDEWFARSASSSRQMFCARLGFDPEKPYFLYLCSSLFIAQDEVPFVRQWLTRLRQSTHPALRECSVLVRPHPGHAVPWRDVDLSSFGNVVIWPREGAMPLYVDTKAEYFDSLHHSAGVVGVNTSGLIEAGILGRRSFTVLADEFALTQSGTIHFGYLADPGFLSVARTFDEHHAQLAAELDRPSSHEDFARFIQDFVRPAGLDLPATPRLVDAIERLEREKPAPVAAGRVTRHLRSLVRHRLAGRKASRRPSPTAASSADR